ncbi:MAG TPA: alpha-amylase family glycosyl hydrolase [Myxococcota bacterium]|nr:alpha-amylase family glycosyl hydrolase [Myxococcota bacterium]HRY92665.1 alpha-amylase family glycosyl hydrolase [Myxococcota bacterium]HSA21558.1 alpha-amylase family glycosyl hydrolase [Myxococcota bacterium]
MRSPAQLALLSLACAALAAGCPEDDYAQLYRTEPYAPSLSEAGVRALDHLGPTLIDKGVNFGVYSERAEQVELLLFDDPESERPTRRIPLTRFGNVWNIYVQGVGLGQHYGYIAFGPNWVADPGWYPGSILGFQADVDAQGNRFNPNKLLFDPYAVALHRDHDWSKGSIASGPARTEVTWDAASKSTIVASQYEWSEAEAAWQENRRNPDWQGHRRQDMILYEVHPKGFSMSTASGALHPGTFRGVGELAGYLGDLGITAVELMPVMEKPLDGTYWGYNNTNFFAPEISLASRQEFQEPTDEFKWMVDQLHQQGLEVVLDVVYNHTGEGGLWRSKMALDDVMLDSRSELINFEAKEVVGLYNLRGLDNAAYYALSPDRQTFHNDTGVGNQCRTNHTPMRRMILDSLRYWAVEMHVDGFRFDLAPILGAVDQDYESWDAAGSVLQEVIDDPVLRERNVRIIAEPWSLRHYRLGAFPVSQQDPDVAWHEWNGNYRDVVRGFLNYDDRGLNATEGPIDVGGALTGSAALFGGNGRRPFHSINMITTHDGFTLYDLFTYAEKHNLCGPLNPVCCSDPTNPFCDPTSGEDNNRSRDWGADQEDFKRQMVRNAFVMLMISHGSPMILGGDEWLRTQLGNNNAYSTSADNAYNWYDWGVWQANPAKQRMRDFVRQLIRFRKQHAYAFAPAAYDQTAPFAWKTAGNQDMAGGDWGGRVLMQHYYDPAAGPELLVLLNMDAVNEVSFSLPAGRAWLRRLDTQLYFDTDAYLQAGGLDPERSANLWLEAPETISGAYAAKPRSIVIMEAAQ